MKIRELVESLGNNYPGTYEEENAPFKVKGQRRTTDLTEETTTLSKIYSKTGYPEEDELLWQYVGNMELKNPLSVKTLSPQRIANIFEIQYGIDHIDDLLGRLDSDQKKTLKHYKKDPNLSNSIIVVADGKIIDGNHRALAAASNNVSIKYVDLDDLDEEQLDEKWSEKYKRSIDCSHPKGFSQRAHCQGRKK